MSFGERVSPVAAIQAILHDYPFSASILRELLQNSDDAGATKQIFVFDKGVQPALMAYNDSEFQEADWEAIQSIHESSKRADTSKIGKYGVGFRACYHITDQPQILSGVSFAVLDPLHSNGERIEYDKFKTKEYFKDFDFFSSMFNPNSFTGTAIRLPLRSTRSELSEKVVVADELQKMIADYISEELNVSLLFLDKLRTIEIWEISDGSKTHLATWTRSGIKPPRQDPSVPLVTYNTILSDGNTEYSWRIVQTQHSDDEAISRLSQLAGNESVNFIVQKHKLRSDVRIAYPLTSQERMSGRLFTFLPLPSKTAFPIHIHALFALTSSRQSLRNPNETGIVKGSDNDVLIKWNHLLFNHYIPQSWGYLLKTLAEEASCSDIFSAWPPYCSSITSGDGIYWQDILPITFKTVIESALKVWPKVSSEGSTTYVGLESSMIVAQGQVDADVLAVLALLGLTLVQLPQRLLDLVDDSMTKLSPSVTHGKLQEVLDRFDQLSADHRGLVCKYLLSDGDISNIFGLPLIPTLNGPFVALEHRNKSLQRFIALTKGEVAVFRTSACGAIPLDQLSPEMARLLLEQGVNHANIDLLGPRHVIEYMSNEAEIPSNERLTEFWCWVVDWHLQEELMGLLKCNGARRLIPTTKGPQPVPSLVFNVMQNMDNEQLFGKLGLAFIISILPISVVGLLLNYAILKNASDLNHFVTAVNLDSIPSLTDDEAKIIFNHIMACHGPLSADALTKLRKLPIFPVMVPAEEPCPHLSSNSSVTWRSIHEITIKGISPLELIPIADDTRFLGESNIEDTTCSVLKKLHIPVLKDEDVLLRSLELFALQPKPLQAAFVSYMRINQYRLLPRVQEELQKTAFLRTADGSLQSPENVIDPGSPLAELFPQGCKDGRIPINDDEYDKRLFDDFRALCLMRTTLEANLVQERISYISSNSSSPEATTVAFSLLKLMNKRGFSCHGLHIDSNMAWLPTANNGLTTSKQCINSGRRDTDLFDEVLVTLDESVSISPFFKRLLDWDKPLPPEILAVQLRRVLDSSLSDVQSRKIRNIIKELSNPSRPLGDADVQVIREVVDGRAWIPTKSGQLAQPSRAVFVNVEDSSGFHEVAFSKSDKEIYRFLCSMGCLERPTAAVIIEELEVLQEKCKEDGPCFRRAILLLEMLPDSMTEQEFASLLVPDELGYLVPISSGICYYSGSGGVSANNEAVVAHHLVSERLAEKLRLNRLGLEEDIDLGGKPITTIRNGLSQYNPKQFFTEFIANASDAKAKQLSLLIDDHEGLTDPKKLFSAGMAAFQSPSLVVYNDSVFNRDDFRGIRDTGIGGKKGKPNVIGYFGLGALSMFHFTEMAMIVSNGHVLFLNPAKHGLGYRGRHSVLLPLQQVKRLYRGHLEPLDGLFGFDLNSTESYQGTIFRLPLRKQSHLTNEADAVSTDHWSTKTVGGMLLEQFDDLAYKSLLFTGLARIDLRARRDSQLEILRSIEVTRQPDNSTTAVPFEPEIVTFTTINGQRNDRMKWLVLSKPVKIPEEFEKALQGRSNILPVKLAAALDGARTPSAKHNLFCALPLPVTTSLPVHISAPFNLEQQRRDIRLDGLGIESEYNRWLLSSEIPSLYLNLLETLLLTQGANKAWWPPTSQEMNGDNSIAGQVFIAAFWTREVLTTSLRRIFASRTSLTTYLAPKDAVMLDETHSFNRTLSKIVDVSQPANVVDLSGTLVNAAVKAGLRFIDAPFIKDLLQGFQVCKQLDKHDMKMVLLFLCSGNIPIPLDGLPLLPLEDGSYATISSKFSFARTYYVLDRASGAHYPPFRKDCLIHQEFKTLLVNNGYKGIWDRLRNKYNVSPLTDEGVVELTKEFIKPADEFVGDQAHQTWVNEFWRSKVAKPQAVSQFPLVPTFKSPHYISFRRVDDLSVIVLEDKPSEQQSLYRILQTLGLTIIVRQMLPSHLRAAVKTKALGEYPSFLSFVKEHPDKLREMRQLTTDDQEDLGSWIRSQFPHTPKQFAHIACQVPAWPIQEGPNTRLAALDDPDVTILPHRMPVTTLCPFTKHAIMDWKECMRNVKEPCTTQRIVELLWVSAGTVIRSIDRDKYKEFVKKFLKIDKVGDHQLLVPNSNFTLRPASDLFETAELFIATFKSDSPRLLSPDFQELAQDLEKYGLKRQARLDLSMFIDCATAFDSDLDRNKRPRGEVLYRHFNSLRLSPKDAMRCRELDDLRFIPRIDKQRPGYGDVNTIEYMADLPHVLLAPAQITIPIFEPICWSQKGKTEPSPNATLCGTYQSLGEPAGSVVLRHLIVLAEIARDHGYHAGLLLDLKATYRWLNDHADDIASLIKPRRNDKLFLNVDDPVSDEWVWDSASKLVIGLQDVGKIREVKGYLRNYSELLNAAGVRRVRKKQAKPIPACEDTSLDLRGRFNGMRQTGFGTDVVFVAQDSHNRILPAHKTWLVANHDHFETVFLGSGMKESQALEKPQSVTVERSSMCVNGVVDWFYVGKLPDALTNSGSGNDEKTKQRLDLALEMLSLSDQWEVKDLHRHLQEVIIKDPHFVNPYWVRTIREHAEASMAAELLKYCEEYELEGDNQTLIDDFAASGNGV